MDTARTNIDYYISSSGNSGNTNIIKTNELVDSKNNIEDSLPKVNKEEVIQEEVIQGEVI